MFLIRSAFWLALIVMLLPTEKQRQAQLYKTASESAHWAMTFCDRNPVLCEQGARYWATFKTKAEFGAKLVFDVASERLFGVRSGSIDPVVDTVRESPARAAARRIGA